jgi:hypothetical protein
MYPDDDDYVPRSGSTSGFGFVGEAAVGVVRVLMMPILMMSIVMMVLGMLIYMVDAKSGGFKLAAVGGLLFGGTLFAMDKL